MAENPAGYAFMRFSYLGLRSGVGNACSRPRFLPMPVHHPQKSSFTIYMEGSRQDKNTENKYWIDEGKEKVSKTSKSQDFWSPQEKKEQERLLPRRKRSTETLFSEQKRSWERRTKVPKILETRLLCLPRRCPRSTDLSQGWSTVSVTLWHGQHKVGGA